MNKTLNDNGFLCAREVREGPEDHFEDPADYWDSVGDHHRANMIRKRRRQIENGERAEDE